MKFESSLQGFWVQDHLGVWRKCADGGAVGQRGSGDSGPNDLISSESCCGC